MVANNSKLHCLLAFFKIWQGGRLTHLGKGWVVMARHPEVQDDHETILVRVLTSYLPDLFGILTPARLGLAWPLPLGGLSDIL